MNIHYKKEFAESLQNGTKKHTIRQYRIKHGTPLKHVIYPYSKKREAVLENMCKGSQKFEIYWFEDGSFGVFVGGMILTHSDVEQLALNDGFPNIGKFLKYFSVDYKGYIIHWTDIRY